MRFKPPHDDEEEALAFLWSAQGLDDDDEEEFPEEFDIDEIQDLDDGLGDEIPL